jgi:acetate kinase
MHNKYLVINSGSASHKHALYEGEACIYFIHFEMVGDKYVAHETVHTAKKDLEIDASIFSRAIEYTVARLIENQIIENKKDVTAIGMRIVAPGVYFQDNRIIDKIYLKQLKDNKEQAPIHISLVLAELKLAKKNLPKSPIIGVSDSVFHKGMPNVSKYYALPLEVSRQYGIYRYGYHGLSVQSVVARLTAKFGSLPEKVVVCHLGGGASVTAVLNGKSVDTSMGFTPLDGLVMATRVGSIDPGAVVYLSEKLKLRDGKMLDYFNKQCGLLGLSSGKSEDIRELLKAELGGDLNSKLALDVYAMRVKKLIAQGAAVLGGIDTLVFAGTVGERSFPMRRRICSGLDFLGIKLDSEINDRTDAVETEINSTESRVKIVVIKTDEMGEIAKEAARISQIL